MDNTQNLEPVFFFPNRFDLALMNSELKREKGRKTDKIIKCQIF